MLLTSLGGHITAAVIFYLLTGIVLMTGCNVLRVKGGARVQVSVKRFTVYCLAAHCFRCRWTAAVEHKSSSTSDHAKPRHCHSVSPDPEQDTVLL